MMTFKEFLQSMNIDSSTSGADGIVYAAIVACRPDITYREVSLIFADVPVIRDTFERLWYEYESELDQQNYDREHSEPVHVSVVTGAVLTRLMQQKEVTT